jgi:hypothetical protein
MLTGMSDPVNETARAEAAAELEQLKANIKAVDTEIRASYSGADVNDIKPIAARDFAAINLPLSDEELDGYSQAVADGDEYEFAQV